MLDKYNAAQYLKELDPGNWECYDHYESVFWCKKQIDQDDSKRCRLEIVPSHPDVIFLDMSINLYDLLSYTEKVHLAYNIKAGISLIKGDPCIGAAFSMAWKYEHTTKEIKDRREVEMFLLEKADPKDYIALDGNTQRYFEIFEDIFALSEIAKTFSCTE
jgi:hypothetical protein